MGGISLGRERLWVAFVDTFGMAPGACSVGSFLTTLQPLGSITAIVTPEPTADRGRGQSTAAALSRGTANLDPLKNDLKNDPATVVYN